MINARPAQIYCANYDVGKCLGCMMKFTKDGTIYQIIDNKMKGKDCNPDGCIYFETSVLPAIK